MPKMYRLAEKPVRPLRVVKRNMELFEYRSVIYWYKEIDTTLTGGAKKVILLFAALTMPK